MMYVYAIGDPDALPQDGRGPRGEPLEAVCDDSLAAFVQPDVAGVDEPDQRSLSRHDSVVRALMEGGAVLPMRFGTLVSGEDALRDVLVVRRDELRHALARVRGRVEYGIRASWDAGASPNHPGTGREFMLAKLARRASGRSTAHDLHAPLSELAAASMLRLCPDEETAFAAAYLVDRSSMVDFERRAEGISSHAAGVEIARSGPWPPYSFTEARGG
jgi:hypothetical protein